MPELSVPAIEGEPHDANLTDAISSGLCATLRLCHRVGWGGHRADLRDQLGRAGRLDPLRQRGGGRAIAGRPRVGVYPGTFNPPTIAHLAIAQAAQEQGGLDVVELVVSVESLGKEARALPCAAARHRVLQAIADNRSWLTARIAAAQLVAEIADGADAVILGADKWAQVTDPAWYGGDSGMRDTAVAGLPLVLVAPRPPLPLPLVVPGRVQILDLSRDHHAVSSSAVRAGQRAWMLEEAAASGLWSSSSR